MNKQNKLEKFPENIGMSFVIDKKFEGWKFIFVAKEMEKKTNYSRRVHLKEEDFQKVNFIISIKGNPR